MEMGGVVAATFEPWLLSPAPRRIRPLPDSALSPYREGPYSRSVEPRRWEQPYVTLKTHYQDGPEDEVQVLSSFERIAVHARGISASGAESTLQGVLEEWEGDKLRAARSRFACAEGQHEKLRDYEYAEAEWRARLAEENAARMASEERAAQLEAHLRDQMEYLSYAADHETVQAGYAAAAAEEKVQRLERALQQEQYARSVEAAAKQQASTAQEPRSV